MRLPLFLHNAVTTRNARPGDPVYLETFFPIVINDRILKEIHIVAAKRMLARDQCAGAVNTPRGAF
jgi:hypothetical protein